MEMFLQLDLNYYIKINLLKSGIHFLWLHYKIIDNYLVSRIERHSNITRLSLVDVINGYFY